MEKFVEVTEIDPRAIRRLAAAKGQTVTKTGDNSWVCCEVEMNSDEVWAVIQTCK